MDVLAVVLIVLPPVDWLVAMILGRLTMQHPEIVFLRDRAVTAVILAAAASAAGIIAWARLGLFELPDGAGLVILAFICIAVSLPALYWLALVVLGRFGRETDA